MSFPVSEALGVPSIEQINHPQIARIEIFPSKEQTALAAATFIAHQVRENPTSTITFATGETMIPVYQALATMTQTGLVDFSHITAFHLDEYFPADPEQDDFSFVRYLRNRVWNPLRIGRVYELNGRTTAPEEEAARYNELLESHPVDLAILGIGPWSPETETGAHIGFNESGTPFALRTHLQQLDSTTVQRDQIDRGQRSPGMALTQGIQNILEARSILLIAYGEGKGLSLREALGGDIGPKRPASALRLAQSPVTILGDLGVAKLLR